MAYPLLTFIPFYMVRHHNHLWGNRENRETVMQAVRVGGVFFEEPERVFPSEHVFATIALAVKAGVEEES